MCFMMKKVLISVYLLLMKQGTDQSPNVINEEVDWSVSVCILT